MEIIHHFLIILSCVLTFELCVFASDSKYPLLVDSFEEIKWNLVSFQEGQRCLTAKLPGNQEMAIHEKNLYLFQSMHQEVRFGIFFNPSYPFQPPAEVQDFIKTFSYLENAQIFELKAKQPNLIYLLQIHLLSALDGSLQTVLRVYATQDTIYYAIVDGGSSLLTNDFFQSIQIEEVLP